MKARILRAVVLAALIMGPIIVGVATHDSRSLMASSGECWRIDRENCSSCGACWAMYDWMFEEGPDGYPRFVDPNDCGTVSGSRKEVIQVVTPTCIETMQEIDDHLPFDLCIVPCN